MLTRFHFVNGMGFAYACINSLRAVKMMAMSKRLRRLIESRDSWREAAAHDKKQAVGSFACQGAGMAITLSGFAVDAAGLPELGIPVTVIGLAMTKLFHDMGVSEISDAMNMQAKAAIRQHEINRIQAQDPNDWFAEL